MPIKWDVRYANQLRTLEAKFEAIDMDRVIRRGIEQTADDLREVVRTHIVAHPGIESPARLNSPYEHGPGPSMVRRPAWIVEHTGKGTFTVKPHPKVRQRAVILEYGTRDPITPQTGDYLWFTVDGVPRSVEQVSGIEPRGYWRAAMQQIESEFRLRKNLEDAYEDELEMHF